MKSPLLALALALPLPALAAQPAPAPDPDSAATLDAFSDLARDLASKPYVPQDKSVPEAAAKFDYSQYTAIQFRPDKTLWAAENLPFRLQFFYRGYLYPEKVNISLLPPGSGGAPAPVTGGSNDYFQVVTAPENNFTLPAAPPGHGFSGLRILNQLNTPGHFDELAVFQGASYFRMLARTQAYGLSARAVSVNTATPGQWEEFPAFTRLVVRTPQPGATSTEVLALLDGPSLSGAYHFVITPGDTTVADIHARIYLRQTPARLGLAPLTSMFWFGENTYRRFVEFRPEVHDSDGLLLLAADGSRAWRPLQTLVRDCVDHYRADSPRGFGLLQRDRAFTSYQDLEARYQLRPSLWVEPLGDWGPGHLILWQMPTVNEYADNTVASWTPDRLPPPGKPLDIRYRLHWTSDEPPALPPGGRVISTHIKPLYGNADLFRYIVDFAWDDGSTPAPFPDGQVPQIEATSADGGEILEKYVKPNPYTHSWRLSVVVKFSSPEMSVPLRFLLTDGKPAGWRSEAWTYTMTPQGALTPALGPW